jgi:chromosome partitioning protein
MRTIAVVNQKGGSAKTTTSVNLAATLAENDRRVLIIDLDPQHSATAWYDVTEGGRGIFDLFAEPDKLSLESMIFETVSPGVSLVPSSPWLVGAEKALSSEPGAEQLLKEKLGELSPERFDYVLIDCPPTLGILTVNALTAVTEILVPVECHVMGLHGLAQLLKTVETVKKRLNAELRIAGILACRVDLRTKHGRDVVEKVRTKFPNFPYKAMVRENVKVAECASHGIPITVYAPASHGAEDYRALALEVIAQEETSEYGQASAVNN